MKRNLSSSLLAVGITLSLNLFASLSFAKSPTSEGAAEAGVQAAELQVKADRLRLQASEARKKFDKANEEASDLQMKADAADVEASEGDLRAAKLQQKTMANPGDAELMHQLSSAYLESTKNRLHSSELRAQADHARIKAQSDNDKAMDLQTQASDLARQSMDARLKSMQMYSDIQKAQMAKDQPAPTK